ncbi:hypothetical protein GYN07_15355 [Rhizobium leguminosarum bv. viciae 248]|uniref:hypothetical protein n=1 Tax=Rhizobium leguminosarum TaxID=384 RepID=UPI000370E4E1|nr:hypothetical protein [Rhizobium leguminosarum]QHW25631.1 hypothetical protein GYN07_15355 [Rhizobium leguminosarum bv. viciae 248]
MKVYQLIFRLLRLNWHAEVFLVYEGKLVPATSVSPTQNGKVVITKSSEFFASKEDMPIVKPGRIVRLR